MPANLTPQYLKAEEKYRQAQSAQERIDALELMLRQIPKHKGTDRLQGNLRARLKELRAEASREQTSVRTGKSYRIPRQGAGTAIIIGAPNAGKSQLLKSLTGATPEVAPYPFTTREPQAGIMTCEDLTFQLIDTPPITRNFLEGYLVGFIRSADLTLLCIDGSDDEAIAATFDLVQEVQQRKIRFTNRTALDEDDFSIVQVRTICIVTRGRDADAGVRMELLTPQLPVGLPCVFVETDFAEDLDPVRQVVAQSIPVLRIYTRRPGESVPDPAPTPLPPGANVLDLAQKIHLGLAASLKFAKVWNANGSAGKTVDGQYLLQDRDIVELYT